MRFKRKKQKKLDKKEPIISIITPYYNDGEYIEKTAKSVLKQTFENFEWIIVDDGSLEQEKMKLKNIEKLDSRIKIFFKTNGRSGPSKRFWNKKFF